MKTSARWGVGSGPDGAIPRDCMSVERRKGSKTTVDSTGERNMIDSCRFWRDQDAADGSPGAIAAAESRAVGEMEGGPVTERHWASPWQACRFGVWSAAGKGWNSSTRPETIVAVPNSAGSGGNISRINCRLVSAQDCRAAWPTSLNHQSGGGPQSRPLQISCYHRR